MKRKGHKEDRKQKTSSKKESRQNDAQNHEYETMSQIQNRYGHGRQRNGSDGSSKEEVSNNH
jgi:hypothetical protein